MTCSSCGSPVEPGARFCSQCGTPVAAAPSGPVAERRVTSVLFGDLVGFTTLSEARDPEDVRELLSGYFQRCRGIVARYGGTIEKFIGDAVMAVWGVPFAHEDDAERAVRAGLELAEAIAAYGVQSEVDGLALRVGIVTGEVAATIGAEGEGMVAGDAVNTAARVQALAVGGSVWVDAQTEALTRGSIGYVAAGSHELKGRTGSTELFAATGVLDGADPRRGDRVEAPLIGRTDELARIKAAFHLTADEGSGHLLVLSGEPGVGKTRLARELQAYAAALPSAVRWHWGRALAYGDGVAFSPLAAALRGRARVIDTDGPAEIAAKVGRALRGFVIDDADRAWLQPRLSALLVGADHRRFSSDELFAAWLAWFDAMGADGTPVVWVVDDAHHADDGVLDFIDHLVAATRAAVLVVLVTRPELLEARPQLAPSRRVSVIEVATLPEPDMAALLGHLVPGLTATATAVLVERAEGIPLYAVEWVRTLGDGHVGEVAAAAAPTSLRVLISSRLDALPADERAVLATAAVLGQSFTVDALSALTATPPPALGERLARRVHRDLLRVVDDRLSAEDGQYVFVQSLVRQVAYQTISRRDRVERHIAVAEYLEHLPESGGEVSGVIAGHLANVIALLPQSDKRRGGIATRAASWHERAGDRALSLGAPLDAVASFEAALGLVVDVAVAARLHLAAAEGAIVAGRYDAAVAHTRAVSRDLPVEVVAAAVAAQGQALRRSGAPGGARDLLLPWRARLAELPAAVGSELMRELAFSLQVLGEVEAAAPVGEQAMRLAEDSKRPDLIVRALNVLGILSDLRGLWRSARGLYREAAELARETGLQTELGFVLHNLSTLDMSRDVRNAIRTARETLDIAQRTGHTNMANYAATNLIEGMRTAGQWDDALAVSSEPVIGDSIANRLLDVDQIGLDLGLIAIARGEQPPVIALRDEVASMDSALHAAAAGDAATAFDIARKQLLAGYDEAGLEDQFTVRWTATLDWGLEAGLDDEVRALLGLVADAHPGAVTPVLYAQLRRLRGTLERDEADLDAAVEALDRLGARPYAALARAALGTLPGRVGDAAAAQEVFAELGAVAWAARFRA